MAQDTKDLLSVEERAEAEKIIRSQGRNCKGPVRPEITAAMYDRFSDDTKKALGEVKKDDEGLVHPRVIIHRLTEAGHKEAARQLDGVLRPGCGADFNDIVVAGPWDGEQHDYQCPKCKVRGKYTAPMFERKEQAAPEGAAQ